jgi:hypothetical protein
VTGISTTRILVDPGIRPDGDWADDRFDKIAVGKNLFAVESGTPVRRASS